MRSSLVNWRLKIGRVLFLFSSFEALIGERLLFDSTFHRVEEKIKGRERIKRYIKIWMGRLTLSRFINALAKIRGKSGYRMEKRYFGHVEICREEAGGNK